jgi:hypothetical protein
VKSGKPTWRVQAKYWICPNLADERISQAIANLAGQIEQAHRGKAAFGQD